MTDYISPIINASELFNIYQTSGLQKRIKEIGRTAHKEQLAKR